jgi:N-acetylmuramoyl-L-alanine amidase
MSLSKSIGFDELNGMLSTLEKASNFAGALSAIANSGNEYKATTFTQLGKTVNETVNGIQALTSEVDEIAANDLIAPSGIARINKDVPGYESVLTKVVGRPTEISKITEALPANGSLKEILTSTSPKAVSQALETVTGIKPSPSVLTGLSSPEYIPALTASLSSFAPLSDNLKNALSIFSQGIEGVIGAGVGGILNKLIVASNDVIGNELNAITRGTVDPKIINFAVGEILAGRKTSAINLILNNVNVTDGNVDVNLMGKELSALDPSLSNIVSSERVSSVDFGEATTNVFDLYQNETNWKGAETQIGNPKNPSTVFRSSPADSPSQNTTSSPADSPSQNTTSPSASGNYGFTFVNSFEELMSDFRGTNRPITETVVHWTAHYIDQGQVGSEQLHQIAISRGFSGCSYHYIIKRNGDLQRGRPINQIGAHAKANGHNNYSIGISMVGGYNCPSGTPNPEKYAGSGSITAEQWNTLNQFLKSFYTIWPGGQVWGHNDTDPGNKIDPGIDIPDYVFRRFGKKNISPSGTYPPLSPEQLASS